MPNIKNKIRNAFEEETPNIKNRVVSACETETQLAPLPQPSRKLGVFKFVALALSFGLTFGLGIMLGNFKLKDTSEVYSALYIDVNPSIELTLNSSNSVINCNAINEDAKQILEELELEGVSINTAVYTVVGALYIHGYLTEENNSVLISVESKHADGGNEILQNAKSQIDNAFKNSNIDCSVISQKLNVNENLKERAKNHGVSVGKVAYVDEILKEITSSTEEDLFKLSINELNLINTVNKEENNSSGKPNGFIDKSSVLNTILEKLKITENEVESYSVQALPAKREHFRVVYVITVKIKGDENIYKFEADAVLGTVFDDVHPDYEHRR